MAEIDEELGQYVEPQQQQGSWEQLLKDPVARSGLLSFGLQALTGGWGNSAQQMGSALGAGAAGAEGTAKALQAQTKDTRDFEASQGNKAADRRSREKEAALNRASREEISRYGADLRLQGIQERIAGTIERAKMIHGPKSDQEWKMLQEARKEARKTIEGSIQDIKLDKDQRDQWIEATALEKLNNARRQGVFGGGAPAPGPQSNAPSTNSPEGAGRFAQDPSRPRVVPSPDAPQSAQTSTSKRQLSWDDVIRLPGFDAAMATEEGKAKLRLEQPHLAPYIDTYGKPGYNAPHNLVRRMFNYPALPPE